MIDWAFSDTFFTESGNKILVEKVRLSINSGLYLNYFSIFVPKIRRHHTKHLKGLIKGWVFLVNKKGNFLSWLAFSILSQSQQFCQTLIKAFFQVFDNKRIIFIEPFIALPWNLVKVFKNRAKQKSNLYHYCGKETLWYLKTNKKFDLLVLLTNRQIERQKTIRIFLK